MEKNKEVRKKNLTKPNKDSFVFYISYFESLQALGESARLQTYDAIMKYAFYGEEPTNLPRKALPVLIMAKPLLDAARKNYSRTIKRNQNQAYDSFEEDSMKKVSLPKKSAELPADEFEE